MRKNRRRHHETRFWFIILIVVFVCIATSIGIEISKESNRKKSISATEKIIQGCRLEKVYLISFAPQTDILVVSKNFGGKYSEKAKYHIPFLPTAPKDYEYVQKIEVFAGAKKYQVVFDQCGNAYWLK